MISRIEYFGMHLNSPDRTPEVDKNAEELLWKVNKLMQVMMDDGVEFPINSATHSQVSGAGYGGFRPRNCAQGAERSSHKEGKAVDIYDPDGEIDTWLLANEPKLKDFGLWFEHPSTTRNWSHWTIRAPKSGNRFFYP